MFVQTSADDQIWVAIRSGLLFGRYSDRILAWVPAILTKNSCGFPQSLQINDLLLRNPYLFTNRDHLPQFIRLGSNLNSVIKLSKNRVKFKRNYPVIISILFFFYSLRGSGNLPCANSELGLILKLWILQIFYKTSWTWNSRHSTKKRGHIHLSTERILTRDPSVRAVLHRAATPNRWLSRSVP
jgi:hypothetical protein